jgi:basic amino acid/polyamine antiporter, APA family
LIPRACLRRRFPAIQLQESIPFGGPVNESAPHIKSPSKAVELPRVLSVWAAAAIVVGTIIGTGIFLVPYEMIRATGSGSLVYLAWLTGGVLTLFGALTYAELAAMMPQTGGEYVFLRNAYGDFPAFLYMWTSFSVAKPAGIASVAMGLARTLGIFHSFSWLDGVLIASPLTIRWSQVFAIATVWLITGLNYLGMKKAGAFQLFFTWLKVLVLLAIIVFCLQSPRGRLLDFGTIFSGAQGGFAGFMTALIATLWAYDGWNDLTLVAGEVKRPQRNLPIALVAGVGVVGALYILTNLAIQYILPAAAVAASPSPALAALSVAGGPWGAAVVSIGMVLSIVVTLNGATMAAARVPFAAARDRLFFPVIARIHPRFQSPSTSLVVQAWVSTLLLVLIGRFQQLFELAIFARWLFYMLTTSTIFFYRPRTSDEDRPFRAWGYPVVPALFILAAATVLCYSYIGNFRNSLIGTAIILAGIPLFALLRKRTITADHTPSVHSS